MESTSEALDANISNYHKALLTKTLATTRQLPLRVYLVLNKQYQGGLKVILDYLPLHCNPPSKKDQNTFK